MRHVLVILVGALSIAGPAIAQDAKKEQEAPASRPATTGLRERIQALEDEYKKAMEEFDKRIRAADTDEKKEAVFKESYPDPAKWVGRYAELLKGNEADPDVVPILGMMIANGEVEEGKPAIDALLKHHKKSKGIGNAVTMLGMRGGDIAKKALKEIFAVNPEKDVKGRCLYGLFSMAQAAGAEKDMRQIAAMIQKDYKDIEFAPGYAIGKMVEGEIFKLDNLSVGKPAPEIEGKDFEGTAFKLSDYKGKVVMLDFWGFW